MGNDVSLRLVLEVVWTERARGWLLVSMGVFRLVFAAWRGTVATVVELVLALTAGESPSTRGTRSIQKRGILSLCQSSPIPSTRPRGDSGFAHADIDLAPTEMACPQEEHRHPLYTLHFPISPSEPRATSQEAQGILASAAVQRSGRRHHPSGLMGQPLLISRVSRLDPGYLLPCFALCYPTRNANFSPVAVFGYGISCAVRRAPHMPGRRRVVRIAATVRPAVVLALGSSPISPRYSTRLWNHPIAGTLYFHVYEGESGGVKPCTSSWRCRLVQETEPWKGGRDASSTALNSQRTPNPLIHTQPRSPKRGSSCGLSPRKMMPSARRAAYLHPGPLNHISPSHPFSSCPTRLEYPLP